MFVVVTKFCKAIFGGLIIVSNLATSAEAATAGVLSKKLFLKFRNIQRKTPVLESLINVGGIQDLLIRHSNTYVFL